MELPFEIVRELGRGAAGLVFEVRKPDDPRRLVAKILLAPTDLARQRFQREGEVVARLRHPGIVPVHGSGFLADGRPYLLMELVEGETLADLLRREASLEPERAQDFGYQLASALAHSHEAGVVHRDVKPANVLVDEDGRLRLTDFGVARVQDASRLTVTGGMVGTPAYMAPEQMSGVPDAIGPACDVYAWGVVVFQMLTGELPPSHREGDPRELRPEIGVALADLVRRCLGGNPVDRPADGNALLDALDGLDPPRGVGAGTKVAFVLALIALFAGGAVALVGPVGGEAKAAAQSPTATPAADASAPSPSQSAPRGPAPVALELAVGATSVYELQATQANGLMNQRMTWRAAHLVEREESPGVFWIKATILAGRLEMDMGAGFKVLFDSDKPTGNENDPRFASLSAFAGRTYEFRQVASSGLVNGFRGGDVMARELKQGGFQGNWLEDRTLMRMFNGLWGVLPGRPAEREDSWQLPFLHRICGLPQIPECLVTSARRGRTVLRVGDPREALSKSSKVRAYWGEVEWKEGLVREAATNLRTPNGLIEWRLRFVK